MSNPEYPAELTLTVRVETTYGPLVLSFYPRGEIAPGLTLAQRDELRAVLRSIGERGVQTLDELVTSVLTHGETPGERNRRQRNAYVYDRDRFPCEGRVYAPDVLDHWHPCRVFGVRRDESTGRPLLYRVGVPHGVMTMPLPRNTRRKQRPRWLEGRDTAWVRAKCVELGPMPAVPTDPLLDPTRPHRPERRKVAPIVDRPQAGRRRGPVKLTIDGVDVPVAEPVEPGDVARGTRAEQPAAPQPRTIDPAQLDVWLAEATTSPNGLADRYTYDIVNTGDPSARGRTLRLVCTRHCTDAELRELAVRLLSDPALTTTPPPPVESSTLIGDAVTPPWYFRRPRL